MQKKKRSSVFFTGNNLTDETTKLTKGLTQNKYPYAILSPKWFVIGELYLFLYLSLISYICCSNKDQHYERSKQSNFNRQPGQGP